MEQKKNSHNYIIPPSFFRKKENIISENSAKIDIQTKEVTEKENTNTLAEQNISNTLVQENSSIYQTNVSKESSSLLTLKRKTSGLSLNSIKKKKEHQDKKVEKIIDPKNLPVDIFSEADMVLAWKAYGKLQDKKGERIVGSMFAMNTPTLDGINLCIELPNESMKLDLENAQAGLLQYLYNKLNNYSIGLKIKVNEDISKKYAFTPQDKYEKLREKNPLLDKLRSSFDLDI